MARMVVGMPKLMKEIMKDKTEGATKTIPSCAFAKAPRERAQRDDVVAFLERQDPELAKARQGRESCLATTFGEESAPCSELSCVVA